ncbi:MAG: TOBE domain-containing protein, partial [Actinomycetota bacterium]|nr:TOBE domain-containing protein [Actinomycetota bacterium]
VTHDQQEALAIGDRVAVMRAGRLEQAGPPETVFHGPVNRFVATFTGEADFLPVERRRGEQLVTELGPVAVVWDELPASGQVEVMVRPHELALHADPSGTSCVVDEEFQGAFMLYHVRLPSGRIVRSLQPHTAVLPPGTRVVAELAHGHPPAVFIDGETITTGHLVSAGTPGQVAQTVPR